MNATVRSHSKRFTLIELLVVVAIIAILASLLLPVLSRVRYRANLILCLNQQKQIGMGLTLYADDNEGRYPTVDCPDDVACSGESKNKHHDVGGKQAREAVASVRERISSGRDHFNYMTKDNLTYFGGKAAAKEIFTCPLYKPVAKYVKNQPYDGWGGNGFVSYNLMFNWDTGFYGLGKTMTRVGETWRTNGSGYWKAMDSRYKETDLLVGDYVAIRTNTYGTLSRHYSFGAETKPDNWQGAPCPNPYRVYGPVDANFLRSDLSGSTSRGMWPLRPNVVGSTERGGLLFPREHFE